MTGPLFFLTGTMTAAGRARTRKLSGPAPRALRENQVNLFRRRTKSSQRSGRDDPLSPQSGEQVQERTQCRLVLVEAGQAALGPVGPDLAFTPQIHVGMPAR